MLDGNMLYLVLVEAQHTGDFQLNTNILMPWQVAPASPNQIACSLEYWMFYSSTQEVSRETHGLDFMGKKIE